jgi:hypothetical protein
MTATEETTEATSAEEEKLFNEILGMPNDPDRPWAPGDLFSLDLVKRDDGDDIPSILVTEQFEFFPAGQVVLALRKVADMFEKKVIAHREIRDEVAKAQDQYAGFLAGGMDKGKARQKALLLLLGAAKDHAAAEIADLLNELDEKNDDGGEAPPTP